MSISAVFSAMAAALLQDIDVFQKSIVQKVIELRDGSDGDKNVSLVKEANALLDAAAAVPSTSAPVTVRLHALSRVQNALDELSFEPIATPPQRAPAMPRVEEHVDSEINKLSPEDAFLVRGTLELHAWYTSRRESLQAFQWHTRIDPYIPIRSLSSYQASHMPISILFGIEGYGAVQFQSMQQIYRHSNARAEMKARHGLDSFNVGPCDEKALQSAIELSPITACQGAAWRHIAVIVLLENGAVFGGTIARPIQQLDFRKNTSLVHSSTAARVFSAAPPPHRLGGRDFDQLYVAWKDIPATSSEMRSARVSAAFSAMNDAKTDSGFAESPFPSDSQGASTFAVQAQCHSSGLEMKMCWGDALVLDFVHPELSHSTVGHLYRGEDWRIPDFEFVRPELDEAYTSFVVDHEGVRVAYKPHARFPKESATATGSMLATVESTTAATVHVPIAVDGSRSGFDPTTTSAHNAVQSRMRDDPPQTLEQARSWLGGAAPWKIQEIFIYTLELARRR